MCNMFFQCVFQSDNNFMHFDLVGSPCLEVKLHRPQRSKLTCTSLGKFSITRGEWAEVLVVGDRC